MFPNIFPRNLLGLLRQTNPHRRLQPVMLELMPLRQYLDTMAPLPADRQILHPAEIARAQTFSHGNRQQEWLTGRICAKMAAIHFLNSLAAGTASPHQPRLLQTDSDDQGRPVFRGPLAEKLSTAHVTLSHGAHYAAALVADCPCGIDIQEPRDSLFRVREKFCTQEEEELLQEYFGELRELQQLTLLWAAKEAAKKALSRLRMPGFLELIFNEAEAHATGWSIRLLVSTRHFKDYPATIHTAGEMYDDYALALCLCPEEKGDA